MRGWEVYYIGLPTLKTMAGDDLNIHYEAFPRPLVMAVDKICDTAKANGSASTITKDKDWETVRFIFDSWAKLFPDDYKWFTESIRFFREQGDIKGVAKEKGGAVVQHSLEVPQVFHRMVDIIFPDQKWDTEFARELAHRLPILRPTRDKL